MARCFKKNREFISFEISNDFTEIMRNERKKEIHSQSFHNYAYLFGGENRPKMDKFLQFYVTK